MNNKLVLIVAIVTALLGIAPILATIEINTCNEGETPWYETNFFMLPEFKCDPQQHSHLKMYTTGNQHKIILDTVTSTIYLYELGMKRLNWRYRISSVRRVDQIVSSYVTGLGEIIVAYHSGELSLVEMYDVFRGVLLWSRSHKKFESFDLSVEPNEIYAYLSLVVTNTSSHLDLNFIECHNPRMVTLNDRQLFFVEISVSSGCATNNFAKGDHNLPRSFRQKIVADPVGISTIVVCNATSFTQVSRYSLSELFVNQNSTPIWNHFYQANPSEISVVNDPSHNVLIVKIGKASLHAYRMDTGAVLPWVNGAVVPDKIYRSAEYLYAYYSHYFDDIGTEYYGYIQKLKGITKIWHIEIDCPRNFVTDMVEFNADTFQQDFDLLFCDIDGNLFYQYLLSTCNMCKPGSYGVSQIDSATQTTFCLPCPAGSFSEEEGATECNSCPAGTFSKITRASSEAACLKCREGTFNNQTGQSHCQPCSLNWYSSEGAQSCKECPFGTHSFSGIDALNLASCATCEAGNIMRPDRSCERCYSPGLGDSNPLFCPIGSFQPMNRSYIQPTTASTDYFNPLDSEFQKEQKYSLIEYYSISSAAFVVLLFMLVLIFSWVLVCGGNIKDFDIMFMKYNYVRSGQSYKKLATAKGAIFTAIATSIIVAVLGMSLYDFLYLNVFYNVVLTQVPVNYPVGNHEITVYLHGALKTQSLGDADASVWGWELSENSTSQIFVEEVGESTIAIVWSCQECRLGSLFSRIQISYVNEGVSASSIDVNVTVPWYKLGNDKPSFTLTTERMIASSDGSAVYRGSDQNVIYITSSPSVYVDGEEQWTGANLQPSLSVQGAKATSTNFALHADVIHLLISIESSPNTIVTTKHYKQTFLNALAQAFSLVGTVVAVMGFSLMRIDMIMQGLRHLKWTRLNRKITKLQMSSSDSSMNPSINDADESSDNATAVVNERVPLL